MSEEWRVSEQGEYELEEEGLDEGQESESEVTWYQKRDTGYNKTRYSGRR